MTFNDWYFKNKLTGHFLETESHSGVMRHIDVANGVVYHVYAYRDADHNTTGYTPSPLNSLFLYCPDSRLSEYQTAKGRVAFALAWQEYQQAKTSEVNDESNQ